MTPVFLFRTDASAAVGTGHVMRCLSLAQALADAGHTQEFLSSPLPEGIRGRLDDERISVKTLSVKPYDADDAAKTVEHARAICAEWIVVDGYSFDGTYMDLLKREGLHVLWIDDYGHAKTYSSDIILNQNAYASAKLYESRTPETVLLLGTRYALLQRNFRLNRPGKTLIPAQANHVLVTLGGGDPENVTGKLIDALTSLKDIQSTVIIGGANPHATELKKRCAGAGIRIMQDARSMRELMMEADMAVTAGGTTCYELAYMGVPALMIIHAENQEAVANALDDAGAGVNLGWHTQLSTDALQDAIRSLAKDADRRMRISQRAQDLVDGEGADRVVMRITGNRIRLRSAREEDARMLWEWANNEETRQTSFSSDAIPWETHVSWFHSMLHHPQHHFWIAVDSEDKPVGSIRFAMGGKNTTLSVSIAPQYRGKGFGTEMVHMGCGRLFANTEAHCIHAYVKLENAASKKLFIKTGFTEEKPVTMKGQSALHFLLRKTSP